MQATGSSLSYNFSFPLCISGGVTRPLTLSKEMADHDRRRRILRRERSSAVAGRSFDSGASTRLFRRASRGGVVAPAEIRGDDVDVVGIGAVVVGDENSSVSGTGTGTCPSRAFCWPCVAKAA